MTCRAKGKTTCAAGVDLVEEGRIFCKSCQDFSSDLLLCSLKKVFVVVGLNLIFHFSVLFLGGSEVQSEGTESHYTGPHYRCDVITSAVCLLWLLPLPAVALDSFSPPLCQSSLVQLLPKSIQLIAQKTWNSLSSSVDTGLNTAPLLKTNLNPSLCYTIPSLFQLPPESLSFPSVRRSEWPLSPLDKHVPLRKVISQQLLGYRLVALGLATPKLQECAEPVRSTRTCKRKGMLENLKAEGLLRKNEVEGKKKKSFSL